MDQVISSINFSTILYWNAQYNLTVLKNRLFLYFSKNAVASLRTAESLAVFYKLIKEEILVSLPQQGGNFADLNENKRDRFYEG